MKTVVNMVSCGAIGSFSAYVSKRFGLDNDLTCFVMLGLYLVGYLNSAPWRRL